LIVSTGDTVDGCLEMQTFNAVIAYSYWSVRDEWRFKALFYSPHFLSGKAWRRIGWWN
jgi:hypothetical protein